MVELVVREEEGLYRVYKRSSPVGSGPELRIHGCDTEMRVNGPPRIYGAERVWEDGAAVHVSDDKRAGRGDAFGGGFY